MKHFSILLVIFICVISACNNSSSPSGGDSGYVIKGTIMGAGGSPVFLDKMSFNQNSVVDTAIIAQDGSFTMTGDIEEKGLYLLRVSQNQNWLLVLDQGELTFNADVKDIYKYTVSGSDEAKICASFLIRAGENQQELNALNQQFNQARFSGDMQKLIAVQQQYQQKAGAAQNYIKTFIDTTSYPLVAVFAASLLDINQNVDFLDSFLTSAEQKLPGSSYVQELSYKINAQAALNIGREAPDFKLKSPKGEELPLSGSRGKVVLVDFWASWCRPCRRENPHLVSLYEKYKDDGFDVYSVSLDKNLQKWVKAIEDDQLTWKNHGSNLKGWQCSVAQTYKVTSIPNTYLLDQEGKIIAKNLRGASLESKLEEIFGS